jgi:hypothetical protein
MFHRNAGYDVQNDLVPYQKAIRFITTEEISDLTQISLEVKISLFFYRLTTDAWKEIYRIITGATNELA